MNEQQYLPLHELVKLFDFDPLSEKRHSLESKEDYKLRRKQNKLAISSYLKKGIPSYELRHKQKPITNIQKAIRKNRLVNKENFNQ